MKTGHQKHPVFEWIGFSNDRISDPHYNLKHTFNEVRLVSKLFEDIFPDIISVFFVQSFHCRSFSCRGPRIEQSQEISILSSFCLVVGSRFGRLSRHHFRSFSRCEKSRCDVFLSIFFDDESTLNERRRFTDVLKIVSKAICQTIQTG